MKQKPDQLIIHFVLLALRFGLALSGSGADFARALALALASADRLVALGGALIATVFGKIGLQKAKLVRW